jgi:hypothetical protein
LSGADLCAFPYWTRDFVIQRGVTRMSALGLALKLIHVITGGMVAAGYQQWG